MLQQVAHQDDIEHFVLKRQAAGVGPNGRNVRKEPASRSEHLLGNVHAKPGQSRLMCFKVRPQRTWATTHVQYAIAELGQDLSQRPAIG